MSRGLKFAPPEPVVTRSLGLGQFIWFPLGAALLAGWATLSLIGRL